MSNLTQKFRAIVARPVTAHTYQTYAWAAAATLLLSTDTPQGLAQLWAEFPNHARELRALASEALPRCDYHHHRWVETVLRIPEEVIRAALEATASSVRPPATWDAERRAGPWTAAKAASTLITDVMADDINRGEVFMALSLRVDDDLAAELANLAGLPPERAVRERLLVLTRTCRVLRKTSREVRGDLPKQWGRNGIPVITTTAQARAVRITAHVRDAAWGAIRESELR